MTILQEIQKWSIGLQFDDLFMFKISDAITAIYRIPTQLLLVISVAAACILFVPNDVAKVLALDSFRDNYRIFLGPGLLLLLSWTVARLITPLTTNAAERNSLRKREKQLEHLTPEEQGYLSIFVIDGKTTIYVPVDDGIIGGLKARSIVYRSSNIFTMMDGAPYNLQPWARDYLQNNLHLIKDGLGRPITLRERFRLKW